MPSGRSVSGCDQHDELPSMHSENIKKSNRYVFSIDMNQGYGTLAYLSITLEGKRLSD